MVIEYLGCIIPSSTDSWRELGAYWETGSVIKCIEYSSPCTIHTRVDGNLSLLILFFYFLDHFETRWRLNADGVQCASIDRQLALELVGVTERIVYVHRYISNTCVPRSLSGLGRTDERLLGAAHRHDGRWIQRCAGIQTGRVEFKFWRKWKISQRPVRWVTYSSWAVDRMWGLYAQYNISIFTHTPPSYPDTLSP